MPPQEQDRFTDEQLQSIASDPRFDESARQRLTRRERARLDALTRSSGGRFFSGVVRGAGLSPEDIRATVELGKGLFTSPIDTVSALGHGMIGAQAEQADRAVDASRRGEKLATLGHGVAASVPMLGPQLADIAGRVGAGDIAGSLGELLGVVSPFAAGRAGVALNAARNRRLARNTPRGVELTRFERTGSGISGFFEGLAEKVLMGSPFFKALRERQQVQLAKLADTTARRILDEDLVNPHRDFRAVGKQTQQALAEGEAAMNAMVSELYQRIDDLTISQKVNVDVPVTRTSKHLVDPQGNPVLVPGMETVAELRGPALVSTKSFQSVARKLLKELEEQQQLLPNSELSRPLDLLRSLVDGPEKVSFTTADKVRSVYGSLSVDPGAKQAGLVKALGAEFSRRIDEAMTAAADASNVPGLRDLLDEARAAKIALETDFREGLVKKIIEARNPEALSNFIFNAPLDDIDTMMRVLPDEQVDAVRAAMFRGMIQRFTIGDTIDKANSATPDLGQQRLRGLELVNRIEELQEAKSGRLTTILGQGAANEMAEIAQLAAKVKGKLGKAAGGTTFDSSIVASGLNLGLVGSVLGMVIPGMPVGALSAAIPPQVAIGMLSAVLANPRGLPAIHSLLTALDTNNKRAAVTAAGRISAMIGDASGFDAAGSALNDIQTRETRRPMSGIQRVAQGLNP